MSKGELRMLIEDAQIPYHFDGHGMYLICEDSLAQLAEFIEVNVKNALEDEIRDELNRQIASRFCDDGK